MENLKVGEIYHITDNEYPGKKIIYRHEGMADSQRGYGFYISDLNGSEFEFRKSTPYLQGRNIKKATELESEWLKCCIKNDAYIRYCDFMIKHNLKGRKVRALIDRPNAGMVLKGEIGIITSTSGSIYVDFPSQQGYILNGGIDESKIELLPPDFIGDKPIKLKWYMKYEPMTENQFKFLIYHLGKQFVQHCHFTYTLSNFKINGFIRESDCSTGWSIDNNNQGHEVLKKISDFIPLHEVGKWYKFKGKDTYAKFKDISPCGKHFYFSECIVEGKYEKVEGSWYTNHCKNYAPNIEILNFTEPIKKMKKFPIGPIGIKDIRNGRVYSNFTSAIKNVKHGNCELADNPDIRIIGYEDHLYVVRWTDNIGREVIQGFKEEDLVEAKNPEKLVFGKFSIGDIVVSMTDVTGYRDNGDLFVVLPNSSKNTLWYRTHIYNDEINSTKSDGWRLATDDEKKLYENGITNIEYRCCVKITKENAYQLNLFLELNKGKYNGYHPYWGVSEASIGKFFHFPSYKSKSVGGYIHTSSEKYYPEVTLKELYEKAGYKPIEKRPEIKAVLEEMAFRIKDHKKEQKDNRLIQLKIRDKSVTTTTQQRVRLRIIKPSLITIKN